MDIVKEVYRLSSNFPQEELYGLTMQMRRAGISIPSNVAEGFKRNHSKEYRQFLHVALGSAAELETQLMIAQELGFLGKEDLNGLIEKLDHLSRMISSLLNKLT